MDLNGALNAGLLPADPFGASVPMHPEPEPEPEEQPDQGEPSPSSERVPVAASLPEADAWRKRLDTALDAQQFGAAVDAVRAIARAMNSQADDDDTAAKPTTPRAVIDGWRNEGPVQRLATGVEALDGLCRGGLQVPRRVILVGAPGAAKTGLSVAIGDYLERAGACLAALTVDEDAEDVMMRFAQMTGANRDDVEARDAAVLAQLGVDFECRRMRFYGSTHTIERAVADATAWAKREGSPLVFIFDSLQTVRCEAAERADTPRMIVEANVAAVRRLTDEHRFVALMTSEANRASYKTSDAADTTNDLAAGAESRAIEYGAQLQLMLRTPKDHGDVVHVRVAKNRGADKGEFWLRMNRDRHTFARCDEPGMAPEEQAERAEVERRGNRRGVEADARALASIVSRLSLIHI